MLKGTRRIAKTLAFFGVVTCGIGNNPAFADGASSVLAAIRDAKAAGTDSIQVENLRRETIVNISADTLSDREARERASAVAKVVAHEGCVDKALTVVFVDQANNVKEVDFSSEQLRALRSDDVSVLSSISISTGDQAGNLSMLGACTTVSLTTTAPIAKAPRMEFQGERSKVAGQIEALRAKGVGVTPFIQELSKIDEAYRRADIEGAMASLTRLSSALGEQDRARQEIQTTTTTRARSMQPAYGGGTSRTLASVATTPLNRIGSAGVPSVADFNGSMDGFVSAVINTALKEGLGNYVPHKGPFLVERARIARRIRELELQRVNVQGYASLFNNMEDVVVGQDSRRLNELSMDVRYLQSQLGLQQLEGTVHNPLQNFK